MKEKVYGLSEITRHNMYTSTEISGAAAVGYSSGTAIKVQEVAAAKLPRGYDIDWAGISADEVAQETKRFGCS
jgi:HAE1 family hydrophobic/amphiphilic exporter-1